MSMENIVLFSLFSVTRQIHLPLYIYLQLSTYPPSSIYVYVYPYLLIYLCAPINLPICLYLSVYLYTRFYLPIIYLYLSLSLFDSSFDAYRSTRMKQVFNEAKTQSRFIK